MKIQFAPFLILWITMIFSFQGFTQDAGSKKQRLVKLGARLDSLSTVQLEEAIDLALKNGWPLEGIERVNENGQPVYNMNYNNTAAGTTGTSNLRTNYLVDGTGMKMGIWECCGDTIDGDIPLLTHQDFGNRITIADGTLSSNHSEHATHVAGTLIGEPPSNAPIDSRGMAYKATLDAYGIWNDSGEMAGAGANDIDDVASGKILLSNHSYGSVAGWRWNRDSVGYDWMGGANQFFSGGFDSNFGMYDNAARTWDEISFLAPYYLIVKSSGNDNTDNPLNGTSRVRNGNSGPYFTYNASLHPPGDGVYAGGFDNIPTYGTAKNILTVGAVDNGMNIAPFSSRGPTDDGRIKPDICGVGLALYSAVNSSNNAYDNSQGTSMSSPQVAGSLLLLQEFYKDMHTTGADFLFMKAATLKALAIHTATDRGNPGPDYTFGWGVMNAKKAGDVILKDSWTTGSASAVIIEDSIMSTLVSDRYEFEIKTDVNEELIVTLVYMDTAQTTPAGSNALVNDLDLRVIRLSDQTSFSPAILDPLNPGNNATTGDNDRDNVEQVRIASPGNQNYLVRVSVEGPLANNAPQAFSIIISGLSTSCYASIKHTGIPISSGTYTAQTAILSAGTVEAGSQVTYQSNGKIVLQPGFRAKKQTAAGTGFFKTASGTCN